jgi:hypothetical protein
MFSRTKSSSSEQKRMDALLEKGKRDQAKLLSSAKLLYQISKSSKLPTPESVTVSTLFDKIEREARNEFIKNIHLNELQCILVRTLLVCASGAGRPYAWQLLAKAMPDKEQKNDTPSGKEKLYRRCAKLVHPDKCAHPQAAEAFKILSSMFN